MNNIKIFTTINISKNLYKTTRLIKILPHNTFSTDEK